MLQRFDMCAQHTSAKLMFLSENDTYSLYAHGHTVKNLVSNEVTEAALLKVATLASVIYDANNIITTFEL